MSDDTKETGASQEDIVTDDDLTRAAAETKESDEKVPNVEPVIEPEPEPSEPAVAVEPAELEPEPTVREPEVPAEPDDPSERSALGRKVAAFGDQLARMEQMIGRISVPKDDEPAIEEDLNEPQLHTTQEIREIVQAEKGLDAKAWDNFDAEIGTQGAKAKDSDEMFQKVCAEISANFMPKDARGANVELIYVRAKNAVLSKMVAQPLGKVNPLKGKEPDNPLGKLPEEKILAKETPDIKLTEDEIRGAEGLGVSQEEFKKFLAEGGGEDLPASTGTPL